MCFRKTLIPITYAQAVLDHIPDVNNPTDADIHARALDLAPLDGDFVADATDRMGRLASLLNIGVPGVLVDGEDVFPQNFVYEEIFSTFLARRHNRPYENPCEASVMFISKWYDLTQEILDPTMELGSIPAPETFVHLLRHHLPQKLDFDSWIGRVAIYKLQKTKSLKEGKLESWQPWFGSHHARRSTVIPKGYEHQKDYLPFLGGDGDGMLIWRLFPWGVPSYTEDATLYADVLTGIAKTEDTLVRLSIRIANWTAFWVVVGRANIMRRRRDRVDLTGVDLVEAVIEILGEDWFELPFDYEGKLKRWKYKRSLPMTEQEYFQSMNL